MQAYEGILLHMKAYDGILLCYVENDNVLMQSKAGGLLVVLPALSRTHSCMSHLFTSGPKVSHEARAEHQAVAGLQSSAVQHC